MKHLFKTTLLIILVFLLFSCQKEYNDINETGDISEMTESDAFQEFAKILSKAIQKEPDLRVFLKQEALKQFDKDYDVFYPFVKNNAVNNAMSLSGCLKRYDDSDLLGLIERTIPKLTILIPDWSWVDRDCFCVSTWDTSISDVLVGYQTPSFNLALYLGGQYLTALEPGSFIGSPTLILKSNERMVYSPATKSTPESYGFLYDDFDNTLTKGGTYNFPYDFTWEVQDNYVNNSVLSGKVQDVYSQTQAYYYIPQRDYIYYSMTAQENIGPFDIHYKEVLHKFKLTSLAGCFQETGNSVPEPDYSLKDYWLSGNHNLYSSETLKNLLWAEGNIELVFYIFDGTTVHIKTRSLNIKEAFNVTHVDNIRTYNWIGALQVSHYVVDWSCFEPKWVVVNWPLFSWDLQTHPNEYKIEVYEIDGSSSTEIEETREYTFATNFTFNELFGNSMVKDGYSYGLTETIRDSLSYTITYHTGDDPLGNAFVNYTDDIVVSTTNDKSEINVYSCGQIDIMILPKYL